jgi:hypothetical protein
MFFMKAMNHQEAACTRSDERLLQLKNVFTATIMSIFVIIYYRSSQKLCNFIHIFVSGFTVFQCVDE